MNNRRTGVAYLPVRGLCGLRFSVRPLRTRRYFANLYGLPGRSPRRYPPPNGREVPVALIIHIGNVINRARPQLRRLIGRVAVSRKRTAAAVCAGQPTNSSPGTALTQLCTRRADRLTVPAAAAAAAVTFGRLRYRSRKTGKNRGRGGND